MFWISSALCSKLSPEGRKGSSRCWTSALVRMGAIISGVQTLARSTEEEEEERRSHSYYLLFFLTLCPCCPHFLHIYIYSLSVLNFLILCCLTSIFRVLLYVLCSSRLCPPPFIQPRLCLTCCSLSSYCCRNIHGREDALKVTELDGLVRGWASNRGWGHWCLS